MIPKTIEAHLRSHHGGFEHRVHDSAMTAQELAQREHVTGYRVAKPVVVRLGGALAIAVVSAADQLVLPALEKAAGARAELVPEHDFADRFAPCATGAEPALAVFGLPIFADERLLRADRILMQAGTHEDSVLLDTRGWVECEKVQPVANLGARAELH